MKKCIYSFIILAGSILSSTDMSAARQDYCTIKGSVSCGNEAAGFATVAVMQTDSTLVTGVACDENGNYSIPEIAKGRYIVSASLIGYKTSYMDVTLSRQVQELPHITLEEDAQMLQSAMVTEKVKLVEMKIDKLVVNVSQSAYAQGSNALELMKKAPGVTIDKDGNVKLNGKSVSIWVDGRPSNLNGKSLEALLRSTNGESIDKFELMEHPSSKYDAEGQGGIINIKTKKNLAAGFNGSMGIGGGGMYFGKTGRFPWQESFWTNLGFRTKKTNTYLNVYEGTYVTDLEMSNNLSFENEAGEMFRRSANSLIVNKYSNYNLKLGHDWFIDNKNTVGAIFYMPGEIQNMSSDKGLTQMWLSEVPFQEIVTDIENKSKSRQYNANLNYTHVFDETRSAEMTVNLDYYRNGSFSHNIQNDEAVMVADPDRSIFKVQTVDTDQIYDIYSAKADYQTVLWKRYMFEAGAKWAMSMTRNNGLEKVTEMPDVLSDFLYREHIGAGYFNIAGQFGEKFSAKLGLRGEYTNSFGDWKSAGEQSKNSYFDVFPTAYIGYAASEKVRLSLSYTRRISRPNYNQLDPTKTYVDAQSYLIGSPDLLPSYNQTVSFTSGFGQHLSLSVGYDHSSKLHIQAPSFDETGKEILTWTNGGVQNMAFVAFNVSALPVTKWLDWTLSATGLYTNSNLKDLGQKNSSFAAQLYTDFTFNLPKDWKISLDADYQSPMAYNIYRMRTVFMANFSMKKNLLENRLSLSFRVDDIFNTASNNMDILTPGSSSIYLGQKYYRCKAIVDLTWNFGQAQSTKARKVGNLDEMSRVGNNN